MLSFNPVTVNSVTMPSTMPASIQEGLLVSPNSILYSVIGAPPSEAEGSHDMSTALWVMLLYFNGPSGGNGLSEVEMCLNMLINTKCPSWKGV